MPAEVWPPLWIVEPTLSSGVKAVPASLLPAYYEYATRTSQVSLKRHDVGYAAFALGAQADG